MLTLGILASSVVAGIESDYELLETTVLGSDTASVSFTGLGSYTDYKHLQVRMVARTSQSSVRSLMHINFNSDTGSNYMYHWLDGTGSTVRSLAGVVSSSFAVVGSVAGNTGTANGFGAGVVDILDFSSTTKNTTTRALAGSETGSRIGLFSGLYNDTSAITQIDLESESGNLLTGSRFSLYGLKAGA